jgi:predicted SprT family Zn-dependent metalloprotease
MYTVALLQMGATAMTPMETYDVLREAFRFFNKELFKSKLSESLILLHRHRNAYGYFCADRFAANGSKTTVHEIALNPSHIRERKPKETFSTLVHEMVHQLQQEHGKPPKNAYHNKQWAAMMKEIGLYPSDTAQVGGNETGRYVSHYIVKDGRFEVAFKEFEQKYNLMLFGDIVTASKKEKGKTSKFKFACSKCGQNAWAKITANLLCGDCNELMEEA